MPFPIVPTIDQGKIEVTIEALTHIRKDEEKIEINVLVRSRIPLAKNF